MVVAAERGGAMAEQKGHAGSSVLSRVEHQDAVRSGSRGVLGAGPAGLASMKAISRSIVSNEQLPPRFRRR